MLSLAAPLPPALHADRFATKLFCAVNAPVETDVDQKLYDYVCSGPLLSLCGLQPEDVKAQWGTWMALADRVTANLSMPDKAQLSNSQRLRVFHYYLPVFFWVERQLVAHRAGHAPGAAPALVVGVSAPQGCGKSTLCEALVDLFEFTGLNAASVSVDDFYLTNAEQGAVRDAHPGNPLLELRGNAGSHDLALGTATLAALTAPPAAGKTVSLPRYDKSAFGGRGDRAPADAWGVARLPVDVVLFEGWMLGFTPQPDEAVTSVSADLAPVNAALRAYGEAWDRFVDAWLVVRVSDPACVYAWRGEAEQRMRASGKPGMTDEQVRDFVDRYMPAYQAYLPTLYTAGPTTARPGQLLTVEVDATREPLAQQPAPIM